jgi:hypothetical protein
MPGSQRRKPDLFVTWALCAMPLAGRGADDRGVLASRALQLDGCAREFFEAKAGGGELTAADVGQLADYHARTPGRARGLLFNARHAWLYESHDGHPLSLVKAALTAHGSRELARSFLCRPLPEPPLIRLLRRLCKELRLEAAEAAPGGRRIWMRARRRALPQGRPPSGWLAWQRPASHRAPVADAH